MSFVMCILKTTKRRRNVVYVNKSLVHVVSPDVSDAHPGAVALL